MQTGSERLKEGPSDLNPTAILRSRYFLTLQVRKPKLKLVKRLAQDHIACMWQSLDLNPGLWSSKLRCMPTCFKELALAPATLRESLQPVSGTSLLQVWAPQRAA